MEHGRGQHGVRTSLLDALREVLEGTHAPACDHRHADRFRHGAREREVEAALRAIAVHAGEQDFARAAPCHGAGPFYGIDSTRLASAVGVDLPTAAVLRPRVNGDHDRLRAEAARGFLDEVGVLHGGRVDAHLVRAGVEQLPHVVYATHAAAHG